MTFIRLRGLAGSRHCGLILLSVILLAWYSPVLAGKSPGTSAENARVMIVTENFGNAVTLYSGLCGEDPGNAMINGEYAYALALAGIYDAALVRLDRLWSTGNLTEETIFFTSQVFGLMGYEQVSGEFLSKAGANAAPQWIAAKAPQLLQKYKKPGRMNPLTPDEFVQEFQHANRLTAQHANMQSIALFERLTRSYPQEYLPYVGYSIALEKAGLLGQAIATIETALQITDNRADQQEARQYLDRRLASLRNKQATMPSAARVSAPSVKEDEKSEKQMMVYAGGMAAKQFLSLNTRFGYFVTPSSNIALNLGFSRSAGTPATSIGMLYYARHKIFVAGMGLSGTLANDYKAMYYKVSVGFSIMGKKDTGSWDIFWDGQVPFNKKYATTVGFSIGRSVYFGNKKKK